ncbi:hypothetical protein FRC08_013945 [Ceratobasidium sp. 394]|nr:hypothetical protein FRC08_013945 [Ceratobasidium sp. 394]
MLRQYLGKCLRLGYIHSQMQITSQYSTLFAVPHYQIASSHYRSQHGRGIFSGREPMPPPNPADTSYLEFNILRGDRLGGTVKSVESSTPRRALIVAPIYDDHETMNSTPGIRWMPSTVRDAKLMHQTLVQRGYDPANIRILADGFRFNGVTDPTRENIMDSLDWLVAGVEPGDYRFFHFSGHGVRVASEKGKGKEARKVYEGTRPKSDDTERWPFFWKSPSDRVLGQSLKPSELVYYNEGTCNLHPG